MSASSDDKLISVLNIHYISHDGMIFSTKYETNFGSFRPISKTPILNNNVSFITSPGLNFRYTTPPSNSSGEFDEENYAVVKIENYDPIKHKPKMNIPNMIRCQNCETNYPTKYQYQRHQCEFNAEKVVLKPNADLGDLEKGKKVKYDCHTCGKQFVSKNNLERHQTSHDNSQDNTCEHCNKQFVSENRLRIHKENHCKKAGDISKFYRSDVTVWKCRKCQEVFSSSITAVYHVDTCTDFIELPIDICDIKKDPDAAVEASPSNSEPNNLSTNEHKVIQKISTEILLQCEFCNRTYADKKILLQHQKSHKIDKNYECVVCKESFDSYVTATQHWLKKCSEKANLFYLPKLTYCEFCDRTFKSHEILYTHKIKKKHYTPKRIPDEDIDNPDEELVISTESNNDDSDYVPQGKSCKRGKKVKSEEVGIDKLIEDVLIALEIPVKKPTESVANDDEISDDDSNKENDYSNVKIKSEPHSQGNNSENETSEPIEKKKRGRKRKLPKSAPIKAKKSSHLLEDGYKYQCERCVKIFDAISELEEHREKEHAANYSCEECGQILHSARALLIHSRAHKSLKPYVCDTCGRSYSQTSHLWQHMRFHQGIKPFACPHEGCESRYTIRPDLKDHIRKVHTRERPFKCSVCGKCFLTGSVYYQHRLIHTEDRRYGCDMCDKRFFRADALNNHKRIHTNERPYPCFVCGRLFRQKGDRNKHSRTQHPDAIIN